MRGPLVAAAAAFVVLVIVLTGSLFTVQQTEQVLITQFGRPVRVISTPGLKAKLPFVQTAIDFDRRLLDMDFPSEEVILGDQRRLIVDSFARFRITDPLQYYQAVGPSEEGIRARLTSVAESALRQVLGGEQLLDVLSSRRKSIMEAIRKLVGSEMQGFGVSIEDVRIRRRTRRRS
jgi:membrane protease subunit HflC